jgi:hypothetical protein
MLYIVHGKFGDIYLVVHYRKMQEGIFNSVPKDKGPHTSILRCAKAPLTLSLYDRIQNISITHRYMHRLL